METKKKKIGFILNPYAGIGGKAGLKGSDNYKKIEKLLLQGCERTGCGSSRVLWRRWDCKGHL